MTSGWGKQDNYTVTVTFSQNTLVNPHRIFSWRRTDHVPHMSNHGRSSSRLSATRASLYKHCQTHTISCNMTLDTKSIYRLLYFLVQNVVLNAEWLCKQLILSMMGESACGNNMNFDHENISEEERCTTLSWNIRVLRKMEQLRRSIFEESTIFW